MNLNDFMQYAAALRKLQGYQPGAADANRGQYLRRTGSNGPELANWMLSGTRASGGVPYGPHPGMVEAASGYYVPGGVMSPVMQNARYQAYRPSEPGENPLADQWAARNKANSEAWSQDWRSQLADLGHAGWLQKQMPGAYPGPPAAGFNNLQSQIPESSAVGNWSPGYTGQTTSASPRDSRDYWGSVFERTQDDLARREQTVNDYRDYMRGLNLWG